MASGNRILVVHNRYRTQGGEDAVVANEVGLLRANGYHVAEAFVDNDGIGRGQAGQGRVQTALATPYNAGRIKWMNDRIGEHRPDIVHIHNFFPLLSPAIHGVAARHAAVVQTLHNYRLLCSNAMFLRDGHVCEKCLHGTRLWAVVHACYRQSRLGSAAVAAMQWTADLRATWDRDVDRFIALSEFARSKFVEGGFPRERIDLKPNFVTDAQVSTFAGGAKVLFVGRLAREKGVRLLLEAWRGRPPGATLRIAGEGPEREQLAALNVVGVEFLGRLSAEQIKEEMRQASCLVVPSIWYEGFPMTVVEAFASGLPVIAARIGSLAEIVVDGVNGLHFSPGDVSSLSAALSAIDDGPLRDQLAQGAANSFHMLYTAERNLAMIESVYAEALVSARTRFMRRRGKDA